LKKKTMSMLFVELQTCLSFFVLDDCALFHWDYCCFVSGSYPYLKIQLSSPVMILEIKVGSSLAFSHSSRHMFRCRCFWSFVKSQGTNFAKMWCKFKFSVKISWQTP
jgi:hypothetical protein